MEPTNILPIVAVLSLVTVEYGGWALLSFITGREGLADWQTRFFRAGHAHAGVLLVLTLVYLLYLPRADFSNRFEWIAGGVLLAGVLAQSGGFFLHLGGRGSRTRVSVPAFGFDCRACRPGLPAWSPVGGFAGASAC
jgi:hypothetical protein